MCLEVRPNFGLGSGIFGFNFGLDSKLCISNIMASISVDTLFVTQWCFIMPGFAALVSIHLILPVNRSMPLSKARPSVTD